MVCALSCRIGVYAHKSESNRNFLNTDSSMGRHGITRCTSDQLSIWNSARGPLAYESFEDQLLLNTLMARQSSSWPACERQNS